MSEALELQIEEAWVQLTKMPAKRRRTLYLTSGRRIVYQAVDMRTKRLEEIGTYTRTVTLAVLREDVFWASEQMQGQAHG